MGWFSSSSSTALLPLLLFFLFIFASSLALDHHNPPLLSVVDIKRRVLEVTPSLSLGHSAIHGVKDSSLCERVQVQGIPRLNLWSYASSFHVSLAPSSAIPERLHSKIQVCFHRNNSLGWCQCEKHEGRSVQKGIWSAVMSPYETRYVDVRINGQILGSVTVSLEEDFQQWRLICLVLGLALLLLAPIISSWVPFYYSSSMAIGVFVVIIFLLFQGMKSLLTGDIFYLTICGSMLGAGSFLLCQFSLFVNSILQSLGMSEEMRNPVAVLPGIILFLAGAPSGYLVVRRFVTSKENGTVKCALRIIGVIFIWQSTIDPPLGVGALVICGAVCIELRARRSAWSYSPMRVVYCSINGALWPCISRPFATVVYSSFNGALWPCIFRPFAIVSCVYSPDYHSSEVSPVEQAFEMDGGNFSVDDVPKHPEGTLLKDVSSSPHQSPSAKSTSDIAHDDHSTRKGDAVSSQEVPNSEKNAAAQQSKSSGIRANQMPKEIDSRSAGDMAQGEEEVATSPIEQEHEPVIADPINSIVEATLPMESTKAPTNTIAREDEEEDLLADLGDLDKAISISLAYDDKGKGLPTTSELEIQNTLVKESLIASTTPSLSIDPIVVTSILRQMREFLSHQLEVLATDEGLKRKLFDLLQQFDAIEKSKSLAGHVILLHEFYKNLCVTLPKAQSAISSHQKLIDAQGKVEKDLELYAQIRSTLSASVSRGRAHHEQLSTEIRYLERQLADKKKNRDNLGQALKKNEVNLGKAEEKLSKVVQDKTTIEQELPASMKAVEDAERLHNELGKQLTTLKKAFAESQP